MLRSLFLVTLVSALSLGWFMTELRRASRQTEAVEAIIKSGGTVVYRFAFGGSDCRMRFKRTRPRLLANVAGEGFLAYAVAVDFTAEGWCCDARQVVDADLTPLGSLPYVESLNIEHAFRVTDSGLRDLEHLTRLRVLGLEGTSMTDNGLQYLSAMSQLQDLSLEYPRVPGRGLKFPRCLSGLRKLSLSGPWFADEDLRQLKSLTKLRELSLVGTEITDGGLEQLNGMMQLEKLDLSGTRVTLAGIRSLRDAMPRCYIACTWWRTSRLPRRRTGSGAGDRAVTKGNGKGRDPNDIPLLPGTVKGVGSSVSCVYAETKTRDTFLSVFVF